MKLPLWTLMISNLDCCAEDQMKAWDILWEKLKKITQEKRSKKYLKTKSTKLLLVSAPQEYLDKINKETAKKKKRKKVRGKK